MARPIARLRAVRRAHPVRPSGDGSSSGPSPARGRSPCTRRPPMSAATSLSGASLTSAQEQFAATLSAVEEAVHYAFHKRLRPQEYEEKLAEVRAATWHAWAGLIRRGK